MRRLKRLMLILFASMVMIIALSATAFAEPQVQEITFDTKVVNQLDPVVVTVKTTEPIANAKLYLEGRYGSASSYTQLLAQLFTKVDDYTWQGTVIPGYVAGYTFYPSWLEYTNLSTGRNSTIFFNKDTFPNARFTVYKNWQEELTKDVSLNIGDEQQVPITCNGLDSIIWSINDDDSSNCNVTVTSSNESVAGGYCTSFGISDLGTKLNYTVLAKSEGTSAITISNTNTGQIYGIINVTVSPPLTSNVFACRGQTVSFEVPFISKKSSDRPIYALSGDAGATVISSKETIDQIEVDELAVGDTVQHKCIVTMRFNNTGGYFLNFYDRDRKLVRAYAVNIREHSYSVIEETNATCQKKKTIISRCSYCGNEISEEVGELAEHNWNSYYSIDNNATCNGEGKKSRHCSVCNAINESSIIYIPPLGHDWNSGIITTKPTCTAKGVKTFSCSRCNAKRTEEVDATGHNFFDEFTVDQEPSCTVDGSKSRHCQNCDETIDVAVIPALGHDWDTGTITTKPTCTAKGVKTFSCSRCDATRTEDVDATGHNFADEFTIDQDPSCTVDGSKSKHCLNCNETTDVTVIPATGHTFGDWIEVTPSTCENEGLRQHTCEVCGTVESENLDPNGHDFEEEFTVDVAATCTQDGSQSRHCRNCEAVLDSQVIPAIGHSWEEPVYTWEEDNSSVTATRTCENDKTHQETETVATTVNETQPTYDAEGSIVYSAAFVNGAFAEQTKEIIIPKLDPVGKKGTDGTALGPGASEEAAEATITGMRNDKDPAGSVFGLLQLRSTKQTKKSVTLKWKKVPGAVKYIIYGNKCGTANRMVKQKVVKKTSYNATKVVGNNSKAAKVKKGTYYKFIIVAVDKNGEVLSSSKVVHASTKGGKVGNDKKVTTKAKKNRVTIKKGQKFKLAAKAVPVSRKLKVKRHRAIAYETSDKTIATVNKKGQIKGMKKGTCYVYAYAQDGIFASIRVTVK